MTLEFLSYVDSSGCVLFRGAPCFLLCFIIFCAQHPVSDTNMGLDQMRRIRVSFQFFAQGCHINTQGCNVIFLRTAPYFLREGGMRQHFAHIMRQHTQQLVLDGGQMQFILAQPDAACREIDLQRTIDKNRAVYAVRSQQIQSALCYTQSCQQFIHRKRLCQIIVCAVVQCLDLIRILAPGTQDDDGQVRPCADAADDLDAVYIGSPRSSSMMSGLWLVVIMIAVSPLEAVRYL